MAGLIKMHGRIEASSLVETVVAMIIILSVFGISMMVYMNVVKTGINLSNLNASLQLNELAEKTKKEKLYVDQTIESKGFSIQKKITKYNHDENLLLLEITAKDNGDKILASRKEIILIMLHE